MKRKRGHKKGKRQKMASETSPNQVDEEEEVSTNSDEHSGSEEEEYNEENEDKVETQTQAEAEAEAEESHKPKVETPVGNVRPPTTAVYGRVKVKLKTSKPFTVPVTVPVPPHLHSPVATTTTLPSRPTPDDDPESNGSGVFKEQPVPHNLDDAANSMPDAKKLGAIKIVSTNTVSPPPPPTKQTSPALRNDNHLELKGTDQPSRFNKKDLDASLEVIKKVMKMDAAEPFNVPVNPIELGIPDYFDIIDTPMDFGTIRTNLETGAKYLDSEDVYKDIQYIWNNCYRYNNKGDYIVDLMKRVKKNFMKYWAVAGLYTEQTRKTAGGDGTSMDEATTSTHGKKFKRGKGVKRHKDDCMCAICIMKRRRREREAREAQEACDTGGQATSSQTEIAKSGLPQEFKQEETSHVESPFGDDTSSYMETSPDNDGDVEMEDGENTRMDDVASQYEDEQQGQENRMEFRDKSDRSEDMSEKSQRSDKAEAEPYSNVEARFQDESAAGIKSHSLEQSSMEGQLGGYLQRRELLELEKKRQKFRLLETFCDLENPMLSDLCGALFPRNPQSIWNGANSLVRHQKSRHTSGIHEAIASLVTPSCKSAFSLK